MDQKIETGNTATEIEEILENAWNKFEEYYNKNTPKYKELWEMQKNKKPNGKKPEESHWICWNEYDLMFYIGRFFYEELKKKQEIDRKKEDCKFSNIEIHFEKNITHTNFLDYEFVENIKKLKKKPKVDMIITDETKDSSFLLCAEMKYFHRGLSWYDKEKLFSWDDVPGKDSERLLKFLKDNLKIKWIDNDVKINKGDNYKTITITKENNSLTFKLNEEEGKVILEIGGEALHEYIFKKEKNNEKNIYKTPIEEITKDIKKLKDILDNNIAERVVFMLFDDYYYLHDKENATKIEDTLEGIKKEGKIKVLHFKSEAKK